MQMRNHKNKLYEAAIKRALFWRTRFCQAWQVLIGNAYAAYYINEEGDCLAGCQRHVTCREQYKEK